MQQAHLPFSYPDAIKVFVAPFFDYLYWLGARCRQPHVHVSFSSTSIQSKSSDWLSLVCKVYELCLKQLVNASKKIMEGQMCLFFRIVFALSLGIQLRNTCGRNLGKKVKCKQSNLQINVYALLNYYAMKYTSTLEVEALSPLWLFITKHIFGNSLSVNLVQALYPNHILMGQTFKWLKKCQSQALYPNHILMGQTFKWLKKCQSLASECYIFLFVFLFLSLKTTLSISSVISSYLTKQNYDSTTSL